MFSSKYKIGEFKTLHKTITKKVIQNFADFSGDKNPIHLDSDFAKNSFFKRNIAHGMIAGSFISALIGMDFPGPGTIYLSQNFQFLAPVFVDDELTITVTIKDILAEKGKLILTTNCVNQSGKEVLKGEAIVIPPN
ncbi:MaoC-like protein [Peptostreptococcaceae bacterium oral taxon 113 str. W5053]|nr:MaoC-like protein [Peptostreptococcaceae bacterium oral taxon 113 str. W5053]